MITMNTQEIAFLMECIRWSKKPYYYFKDKYALDLIRYCIGNEAKISTLRKSSLGFLLEKPLVKEVLASTSDGILTSEKLASYWPITPTLAFTLSLSEWGKNEKHRHDTWHQTSRPGLNLVLQLNFGQHHNRLYHQLVQPEADDHPFVVYCHPVNKEQDFTLAWARLDVDLNTGEVLVEEIQNDWLRQAGYVYNRVTHLFNESKERMKDHWFFHYTQSSYGRFRQYYEKVLQPYIAIWDEAMLAAVIAFSKEELGITRLYYHTFESGNCLKHISIDLPPKSLYTKLPRRFGFKETNGAPQFIRNTRYMKKKLAEVEALNWYVLDMQLPAAAPRLTVVRHG